LEKIVEYKVSFSDDYDEAFESTMFWRATAIENAFNLDINDPTELEQKAKRSSRRKTKGRLRLFMIFIATMHTHFQK
jgi:hypothetical protein